ncbi:MAG: HAD family hydrolase [Clostridia bacterium]|nr:HAD family hydrolase [Clostridia bacterium]
MIRGILFDLDGTLLPVELETFAKTYFKALCKELCPMGIAPETLVDAVQQGIAAMVTNDGSATNEERFWAVFEGIAGDKTEALRPACDAFYRGAFHALKSITGENPLARAAVEAARRNGRKVVLSTNPVFPMTAQLARISWIGLEEKDFDFITAYETDCYCKPNPAYFLSVCERMGLKPEECLVIGNDEKEDARTASKAGMQCYLVTDCLIARPECPWNGPKGTFAEMVKMLEELE